MRRVAVIAALASAALLATATADARDPRAFVTPSKNIMCTTHGSELRCDMARTGTPRPPKPESCPADYGHSFGVSRTGNRGKRLCVGDAIGPEHPVIAYGRTWRRNGFTCRVRRSGLRCTNPKNHGFELRIGRQRLF